MRNLPPPEPPGFGTPSMPWPLVHCHGIAPKHSPLISLPLTLSKAQLNFPPSDSLRSCHGDTVTVCSLLRLSFSVPSTPPWQAKPKSLGSHPVQPLGFVVCALPVTLATSTGKVVTVNSLASTREIDAGVGNTYAGNAGDTDAGNAGFGQRG